jgi:C4-dicarboxylate transporter DctQ subunit
LAKFNAAMDALLFYLLASSLAGMVVICFLQVTARYVFSASFSWAEEVSIIILLWSVWVAACLAAKQGFHLRVCILEEKLGRKANLVLRLSLNALAIFFLVVVFFSSRPLLDAMSYMSLMTLPSVPMSVKYVSVPVGCLLLIYYLLRAIVDDVMGLRSQGRNEASAWNSSN